MFIAALFKMDEKGINLNVHHQMNKENVAQTQSQMLFSNKYEWNPITCNNLDATEEN